MARYFAKNTEHGLQPLYPADQDEAKKLSLNEVYEIEIKKPRNIGFHRKLMALFNMGWENTELDLPFEIYRKLMTMRAGYFKAFSTDRGILYEAESLSFSNMNQDTIEDLYSRVMDEIIKDIGSDKKNIVDQIVNFL